MGNPAKSLEEKMMQGTARNDRLAPDPVQADLCQTLPDPPSYLTKTGRKYWKNRTKTLQNQGVLAESDLDLLGLYCLHMQVADEAADELKAGSIRVVMDIDGLPHYVQVPALKTLNEATAHALKIAKEFGFSPLSRKQIPQPKKTSEGKLKALKSIK